MSGAFLTGDLTALFDTDAFADTATYTPSGGSASTIYGILDDEDLELEMGDGRRVLQASAKFTCASSDVTGVAEGDALTVGGSDYTVAYSKDDGTGVIELYLEVD
jgi:hypothetical protein